MDGVSPCAPNPVVPPRQPRPVPPGWRHTRPESVDELLNLVEIGEGVAADGGPEGSKKKKTDEEEDDLEPCRRIYLHAFLGNLNNTVAYRAFMRLMRHHREAGTNGPNEEECLLFAGHVGISFNVLRPIYGFTPDAGGAPGYEVIATLRTKTGAYPGRVKDDTRIFDAAEAEGMDIKRITYVYPKSQYDEIVERFKQARRSTGLTYGFPNGAGDCNCATWPGRIGIPIPEQTGLMSSYMREIGDSHERSQGACRDE